VRAGARIFAATRSVGIVLTRGALQPLRNVLELLVTDYTVK
jgi:hypothetical protein